MRYYEFRKKDTSSDNGYVSVIVHVPNIICAIQAVNRHLQLIGREDLQTHDANDFTQILPSDDGVIYSNVTKEIEPMTTKMKVDFELSDDELTRLWDLGVRLGYKRDDGTKPWKKKEKKAAVRYAIITLAQNAIMNESR